MRRSLKRSEILRDRQSLREVFEVGRRIQGRFLRCYVLGEIKDPTGSTRRVLAAFVVSRSVKRAVDRNRFKRLMRESYRRNKETFLRSIEEFPGSLRLAFLYSPNNLKKAYPPSFSDVEVDVKTILQSIANIHP